MVGDELTERKRLILKSIVEAHIEGGEPVGSKFLMTNKQIACSSATIRNEMAELEEMGYLEQPHTSAGRIPSEQGYRFYVNSLARDYAVTTREIEEINKLLKVKMTEVDQILAMASKVASMLTNYTGIAVKPRNSSVSVKRFEGFAADERNFVLVMMTTTGAIKTKNVRVTNGDITPGTVSLLTSSLNENIAGLTAEEITLPIIMKLETDMGEESQLIGPIIKLIYEALHELDDGELKYSGVDRLLQYPEYSDTDRLRALIGTLENKEEILNIVSDADDEDINIIIGSESPVQVMNNSAIVFKPIVKDGKKVGAVGVIGPLRMDYAKVLGTIAGISGRLADMIDDNTLIDGGEHNGGNKEG